VTLILILLIMLFPSGLVEQARTLYNANQFLQARTILQRAVSADPSDVQARFWLACTYMALDDLEPALRLFEPLDKSLGRDPEYLYVLSEAYTRAARSLANSLVSLGDRSRAHQHLAHRFLNAGDWKMAVFELRVAALLRPDLADVHLETAELFWEQNLYEDAAKELEAELAVSPRSFLANLRYGQYLLRKARFADAIGPLETAVRYRKIPESVLLLAFDLEQMRKFTDAMAALNGGLAIFSGNADILQMRTELTGKYPELRDSRGVFLPPPLIEKVRTASELRATLVRDSRNEDALYLLSELYSERSTQLFERLDHIAPGSAQVLRIRGLNAEAAGDFKQAEDCYRQVLAKEPQAPGGHYALGHLLRQLGRDADAKPEFERELQIDPGNQLAYFELGSMLLVSGDVSVAVPMLEKAVKLQPKLADPKIELAKGYIQLKRATEAIPLLKSVIAMQPEDPTAHYLLSRSFFMTGATEDARREIAAYQEIGRKREELNRRLAQQEEKLKPK
jgi:tetratricopeptide (TPR) repeat protein